MTIQLRALRQSDEQNILAASDAALLRAIPDTLLVVDRDGGICLHHTGSERNRDIDRVVDTVSCLFELASATREPVWRTMLSRTLDERRSLRDDASLPDVDVSFEIRVVPYTDDHAIVLLRDRTQGSGEESQIRRLTFFDSLTGLPNRQSFMIEVSDAIRTGNPFCLLYIDLDNFMRINESLGHSAGDSLLCEVSERIEACVRGDDVVARASGPPVQVARLGGDEFTILVHDVESLDGARRIADRIVDVLIEPFTLGERMVTVTPSIGVVCFPDDGEDLDGLLRHADTALVQAKTASRNRISLYSGSRSREHAEQLELEQELRQAIEHDELELHFQPKLNLAPRYISGVEALVRWRHPRRGMIPPDQFIPVAETSGQIDALGDWVLHAACRQIRSWQATPLADVRVAINLSTQQFRDPRLASRILRSLTRYRLMPDSLDIELTESALMSDAETTIRSLARLKEAGIGIAIDDFGTGFSSLSYLTMLPLDAVKIDKTFVSTVQEEGSDLRSICTAVIAMAHSLGLYVIAEGVETEEQLQYLHFLDCDQVQGFHFARPMAGEQVSEFILEHRAQYPKRSLLAAHPA